MRCSNRRLGVVPLGVVPLGVARLGVALLGTAALCVSVVTGCNDDETVPCDGPSFLLVVPEARAGDVAEVTVSGEVCGPSGVECIEPVEGGGCLRWWIVPDESAGRTPATCEVRVSFVCALPPESIVISWQTLQSGTCEGAYSAEPLSHVLEGTTCDQLAAGAGAAGAAGSGGAAGAAGDAGGSAGAGGAR